MWTGDALALCTSGLPPEMSFDVIDTSNLSDHIGLLNVLVCCAPRLKVYVQLYIRYTIGMKLISIRSCSILFGSDKVLKYRFCRPNTSLLFTSSMLWGGGCENVEEYYNKCVGVPFQLLPTVLGLKLAVDFELGSK